MGLLPRLCVLLLLSAVLFSAASAHPQPQWYRDAYNYGRGMYGGTRDMFRAYNDMREANWRDSDRYFHARGNRDAASHGPGGRFVATAISNAREWTDRLRGGSAANSARDQEANRWGRNGGDPNRYRPNGLPSKY